MVTKRSKDSKQPGKVQPNVPPQAQPARGRHAASAQIPNAQRAQQGAPRQATPASQQGVSRQAVSRQAGSQQRVPQQAGSPGARMPQQPSGQQPRPAQQNSAATPHQIPVQRVAAQQPPRRPAAVQSEAKADTKSKRAGRKKKKAIKTKKTRRIPLVAKVIAAVVLVAAIAAAAFVVWDYLFRYDDAQDFQGQWKIEGSNASIVITEDEIRLTDSVSFTYELNTFDKTIKYEFANYSGEGMYVFSPERDVLTLTDVTPSEDEGDTNQTMKLLKVSNQAIGEPEVANNNATGNADTAGVNVLDGTESAQQAENSEN